MKFSGGLSVDLVKWLRQDEEERLITTYYCAMGNISLIYKGNGDIF